MKRIIPLVAVVGGVGLALWFVVRAQVAQTPQPAGPPAMVQPAMPPASAPSPEATTTPLATEGESIVYQFGDEAKMREFASVWQSRQKTLLRMAVLRAYWENEQAGATALSTQLETQYHLNPAGNYILNAEKRVLMERPASAAGTDAAPLEGQPAQPSADAQEETIVHTFATDEELQAFGNLWQQHQGNGVRLAVLKSFWDEENGELTKLNSTLSGTYQLDVTKNYTLDAQRRVIIEREAPPEQPVPADQPQATSQPPAPSSP